MLTSQMGKTPKKFNREEMEKILYNKKKIEKEGCLMETMIMGEKTTRVYFDSVLFKEKDRNRELMIKYKYNRTELNQFIMVKLI